MFAASMNGMLGFLAMLTRATIAVRVIVGISIVHDFSSGVG
jgi:hypothetical protein